MVDRQVRPAATGRRPPASSGEKPKVTIIASSILRRQRKTEKGS